jgi:hypothetical protein
VARLHHPDRLLLSALHGTAWRRASERASIAEAVVELRKLAAGRNDLLAESAGITAGAWSADPAGHVGTELLTAGLLIYAGSPLDYPALARWVEIGRQRRLSHRRPVHG